MDTLTRRLHRMQRRQGGKQIRSRREVDRLKRRITQLADEIAKNEERISSLRSSHKTRIDNLQERIEALENPE